MECDNQELLRKLQLSILDILKAVIDICENNNIKYVAYGGTCLGAIRHSGFIPWDDDADIAMPRNDYNRFINLCKSDALPDGLVLQCLDTDCHYGEPFIRIRKKDTLCVIPYHKESGWKELGVFLDIFPFDYIDDASLDMLNKRKKRIDFLSRAIANKVAIKHKTIASKMFHLALIGVSLNALIAKRNNLYTKYGSSSSKYVVDYNSAYGIKKGVFPADIFETISYAPFEMTRINVSRAYDEILKTQFGDYMTLPPESKRTAHLPEIIKL